MSLPEIIREVKSSVVMILCRTAYRTRPLTGEFITNGTLPDAIPIATARQSLIWSKGTGFIFDEERGFIGTAYHVVENCAPGTQILILKDNGLHNATIVAFDINADVALLQTEPLGTTSLVLGNYTDGLEGMETIFTGFPLEFDFPITHKGIISSKTQIKYSANRNPVDIFTVNAFVNRGNSGGPLIAFEGENGIKVIGIINARIDINLQAQLLHLPQNYAPGMTIGGVDPIGLSVETYNRALALIGDVGQVGIGFSSSIDYLNNLIPEERE